MPEEVQKYPLLPCDTCDCPDFTPTPGVPDECSSKASTYNGTCKHSFKNNHKA